MIVIVDYGMGNISSISNIIRKIGQKALVSSKELDIKRATKLILPGVGSFDNGMQKLKELGLINILNEKVVVEKIPILGICLGMHLMTEESQEGVSKGLGWVEAKTLKFTHKDLKIPHMGWNTVQKNKKSKLLEDFEEDPRFYFVHSYYVSSKNQRDILTTTSYGHSFVSSFEFNNILGVQFHPEKSHKFGMKIFKNFIENY